VHASVRDQLERYGLADMLDEEHAFDTVDDVVEAYDARASNPPSGVSTSETDPSPPEDAAS
jgi:hypothetical protein